MVQQVLNVGVYWLDDVLTGEITVAGVIPPITAEEGPVFARSKTDLPPSGEGPDRIASNQIQLLIEAEPFNSKRLAIGHLTRELEHSP